MKPLDTFLLFKKTKANTQHKPNPTSQSKAIMQVKKNSNSNDPTCKLILLGNGSVGKSAIIERFVADGFDRVYKQTVGLDFFEKKLVLRGDKRVDLQVWDIGGQSVGSNMLGKYIYGSDVVFLCYDITDKQSFADIEDWLRLVKRSFVDAKAEQSSMEQKRSDIKMEQLKIFIVGNKSDLQHMRKVTEDAHDTFVETNNLTGGFFTSAQSGDNVVVSFYDAAAQKMNIKLSDHELSFHKKALAVSISGGGNDGARASNADSIEEEDMKHGTWQDIVDGKDSSSGCCLIF
jgi:Ras-related protein Rab-28